MTIMTIPYFYFLPQFWAVTLLFCSLVNIARKRFAPRVKKTTLPATRLFLRYVEGIHVYLMRPHMSKKISSLIPFFIVSLVALSEVFVKSLIDGSIEIVSSDPTVLDVIALGDGQFKVVVKGPGLATLIASAYVDLGSEAQLITQRYDFEVYDAAEDATHFDLDIQFPDPAGTELLPDPVLDPTKTA